MLSRKAFQKWLDRLPDDFIAATGNGSCCFLAEFLKVERSLRDVFVGWGVWSYVALGDDYRIQHNLPSWAVQFIVGLSLSGQGLVATKQLAQEVLATA